MNNVTLDIKIQDRLRELISQRGSEQGIKITSVSLGDSDIDYDLSQKREIIKSFKTPFTTQEIKHKLIYEGEVNNISGFIQTNVVKVSKKFDSETVLSSLYNYPPESTVFIEGNTKPKLSNSFDIPMLDFNQQNSSIGYVVFLKTIVDNYVSEIDSELRIIEEYSILYSNTLLTFDSNGIVENISILPGGTSSDKWEIIYDEINCSFLISKPLVYLITGEKRVIEIIGKKTGIKKQLIIQI